MIFLSLIAFCVWKFHFSCFQSPHKMSKHNCTWESLEEKLLIWIFLCLQNAENSFMILRIFGSLLDDDELRDFFMFFLHLARFDAIQYRLTMMLLKVKFMKVPKHEIWNMKNGSIWSEDSQNYFEKTASRSSSGGRQKWVTYN